MYDDRKKGEADQFMNTKRSSDVPKHKHKEIPFSCNLCRCCQGGMDVERMLSSSTRYRRGAVPSWKEE